MFAIGHDGAILPNNDKRFRLKKLFPGVDNAILQDVSEVVLSTVASVLEYVWVVSCDRMIRKDASVMYYLTSNMQYHSLRLAMLVKIATTYIPGSMFTLPDWRGILEGTKFRATCSRCEDRMGGSIKNLGYRISGILLERLSEGSSFVVLQETF